MKSQRVEEFAQDMESLAGRFEQKIPEALELIVPVVYKGIEDNFVYAETPDGVGWPDRKEIGDGHPLLVETRTEGSGSLFSAATGQGGGSVKRIEGNTLIIGVDKEGGIGGIPGAGVHNFGYPPRNVPQREFLGVHESRMDELTETLVEPVLALLG
jgi:phage gpG-like protein